MCMNTCSIDHEIIRVISLIDDNASTIGILIIAFLDLIHTATCRQVW